MDSCLMLRTELSERVVRGFAAGRIALCLAAKMVEAFCLRDLWQFPSPGTVSQSAEIVQRQPPEGLGDFGRLYTNRETAPSQRLRDSSYQVSGAPNIGRLAHGGLLSGL